MADLPATARQARRRIMDQVLRDGTAPTVSELRFDLNLSDEELVGNLRDLEAALCIAIQDEAHADTKIFQDEPLDHGSPAAGEVAYARPFAAFQNHYRVSVAGTQKWYAECAAEACSISAQFPGEEVVVRSICRQTGEPVELTGRDGVLLDYSPNTLRVHLGNPLRIFPESIVGWCDYNSFFATEEAVGEWRKAHPRIKGVTRSPEEMTRVVAEIIGRGRLDYDYQPTLPILTVLLHLNRYGLTRSTPIRIRVPDPFFLPTLGTLREWRRQGLKSFFRFSLT